MIIVTHLVKKVMKNAGIILGIISMMGALVGCGESTDSAVYVEYDLNCNHSGEIRSVFSDVDLTPLEFNGDYYPHGVGMVDITDSVISISDNNASVHLFKADGSFVGCSDSKIGEGPEEFAIVMSSAVNPYDSTIEILTPDRLNKYDMQFNLVSSTAVPTKIGKNGLIFGRIYALSDSMHIMLPTGVSNDPYRIFMFNSNSGELTAVQSFADDIKVFVSMQESCFTRADNGDLLFIPPSFTEYIYKVDEITGKITKTIHIAPAGSFITQREIASLGGTKREQYENMFSLNKEIPLRLDVSANRIFLLTNTKPNIREMKYYVISRDSGEVETFPLFKDDKQAFPLINYVDNNYAYAVMEKFRIEEAAPTLLLNDSHREQLDSIDPESLILLKYRIK